MLSNTLKSVSEFTALESKAYNNFLALLEGSREGIGQKVRDLTELHPARYTQPLNLLIKHFKCGAKDFDRFIGDFMKEVVENYRVDPTVKGSLRSDGYKSISYDSLLWPSTTAPQVPSLVACSVQLHGSGEYRIQLGFYPPIADDGCVVPCYIFRSLDGQMIFTATKDFSKSGSTTEVLGQL
jgi:hypothetical protein